MVKKYVKKPVEIEALDWLNSSFPELEEFVGINNIIYDGTLSMDSISIATLEGTSYALRGDDFVIKGIQGEFYPCKRDIFLATYEEVK